MDELSSFELHKDSSLLFVPVFKAKKACLRMMAHLCLSRTLMKAFKGAGNRVGEVELGEPTSLTTPQLPGQCGGWFSSLQPTPSISDLTETPWHAAGLA